MNRIKTIFGLRTAQVTDYFSQKQSIFKTISMIFQGQVTMNPYQSLSTHSHCPLLPMNYPDQSLVTRLIYNMNSLSNQVTALTHKVASLEEKLGEEQEVANELPGTDTVKKRKRTFVMVQRHSGGTDKVFTKHLRCTAEGCRKRYSSQVALRKHVRTCHHECLQQ